MSVYSCETCITGLLYVLENVPNKTEPQVEG